MKKCYRRLTEMFLLTGVTGAVLGLFAVPATEAAALDSLTDAFKAGEPTLELRLGYEHSNVNDSGNHPANGINLRTRVGYRTGNFYSTSAYIQLHNVTNFMEDLNDTQGGGDPDRDVIADPEGSRVHQAYIDYTGIPSTRIRVGRQEIILDDARLIGNIGWRQHGQSFDAVSLTNTSMPDLTLSAAYVNQVNTIFNTYMDLDSAVWLHGRYEGLPGVGISAFCYLLDTESDADSSRDNATYGLRANGGFGKLSYDLTLALQDDYADGEDHEGEMVTLSGMYNFGAFKLGAGYQYISGQDGRDRPFDTLFSTAHKFNSWADPFLTTNGGNLRNGLEDIYAKAATSVMGVTIKGMYHFFDTTEDFNNFDDDYGEGLDLLMVKKINDNLSGLLKYSYYDEKNDSHLYTDVLGGNDEEVYWARLMYSF